MLCIHLKEEDPWFCLAAEEFLLKNYTDDVFMIWQSHNTVVAGKHQNMLGEVNYRYVREHGIRLARRISGGGTVFHDRGNVNFTYILQVSGPQEISFSRFTEPVREALTLLGITAETSGRNDLLVKGRKISGNAEHVYKNRVLHHGTLLFDADLARLGKAISVIPGTYIGKAVQSNRSPVTNITEWLSRPMTIGTFIDHLLRTQLERHPGSRRVEISAQERRLIEQLAEEKFRTPAWNFFYSPPYTFSRTTAVAGRELTVSLIVEKGKIVSAGLTGSLVTPSLAATAEEALPGTPHLYDEVAAVLARCQWPGDPEITYAFF